MLDDLNERQREFRALAADVAKNIYAPLALQWDRERTFFPDDERKRLADLGFLGISMPEEYGGLGLPLLDSLVVMEELAKECRPAAFQVFEANTGPARHIALLGSAEQKAEILPKVIAGEATVAIGISEPDAGSAATDMTTAAVINGDTVTVRGSKRWISGGGHVDYYYTFCRFDELAGAKGIGVVLVPADAPGVSFGSQEALMGFRGIPSCDIYFDDVTVPVSSIVRGPGHFRELFTGFSVERLGNATMSLALGQAALDRTLAYVQERHQFGRPLVEFQAVQTQLADMVMEVETARALVYRAARDAGTGLPDPLQVSLAKCRANEMAKRVTDIAMQLHGGNGYTEEYGIERMHRDAHGWAIAGGTPAMQRTRIVSELLGRNFNQRRS
ncbi:acyl-CoA dehydrogenase family protein [Streptomyces carpinensis]|uniref:Acyl-CoA dehydrogenase family protein n=1 Tax=Streptomyces carpinensis TaxID=66369 RepID=A0ABV1VV79_9ACTN|nr:acyl-CoA dehydrogenase family protein [Streptomyces carpinensis]